MQLSTPNLPQPSTPNLQAEYVGNATTTAVTALYKTVPIQEVINPNTHTPNLIGFWLINPKP